ncbi:unnamed protein product, partial [Trichobilharzia szidati]
MSGDTDLSLFEFIDRLISKSTLKFNYHNLNVHKIRKRLKIQTYDLAFVFLKGPHKYSNGAVVHPGIDLYEKLHEIVVSELKKMGRDKRARRLDALINSVPRDAELLRKLMFLFLIATPVHGGSSDLEVYGQYETGSNTISSVAYSRLASISDPDYTGVLSSVRCRNSSSSSSAYSLLCKSPSLFNQSDQMGSLSQFTRTASFSNSMFSVIPRHFDFTKSNPLAFRNFATTC